jgi:hypothetical protein
MVAGADLDIFGDGAEILDISVQAPPPQPPP